MCTVTYIPLAENSGFTLTSNRDEKVFRPTLPPVIAWYDKVKVACPKDAKAGGSWIAVNENCRTCCLLNGAFRAHQKQKHQTWSRGQIVMALASSMMDAQAFFLSAQLQHVEPFTMVTIDQVHDQNRSLSEFVWDGTRKHFRTLDKNTAYIWSSATLYSEENRNERKLWFDAFIAKSGDDVIPEKIFDFHTGKHTDDRTLNLMMKREGGLRTVSVTQVTGHDRSIKMKYYDLLQKEQYEVELAEERKKIIDCDLQPL
jgi:uncharacterized protein with NRDE domain